VGKVEIMRISRRDEGLILCDLLETVEITAEDDFGALIVENGVVAKD